MLLYLDDDIVHGQLVKVLRKSGHNVQIPVEVGKYGFDDVLQLTHAVTTDRVLLTHNYDDFEQLHHLIKVAGGRHPGILIVRKGNDRRDMSPAGINKALATFVASGNPIIDQFVILNHYR